MVDFDFYIDVYEGYLCSEEDFNKYKRIAIDDVNYLTRYKELELSECCLVLVQKAICTQIDFLFENGTTGVNISSMSLGKFNYSLGSGTTYNRFDNRVYSLLEQTGLLYRGDILC